MAVKIKTGMGEKEEIDIFEIEEWLSTKFPEFLNAIHYLTPLARCEAMQKLYIEKVG